MTHFPSGLAEMQQRLWELITAPHGVRTALAEAGDAEGHALRALVQEDARLSAIDRLEVYANAYFYRIRDCLKEDYGALHEALGEAGFHDLVTAYLIACPPSHPSLRFGGARLPRFLERHPAAEPFRRRWPWAGDLAALEWAMVDAFDAPDAPALTREELETAPPASWEELQLAFQAAVRLLTLAWPVHELRAAHDRGKLVPPRDAIAPSPTHVCVWRREERVRFRAVDPLEAELLERARASTSFGALCERTAEILGEEAAAGHAAALLSRWIEEGLLAR